MSELMLHGVLNMPIELWREDDLDKMQRHSRYVEASETIRTQQVEIDAYKNTIKSKDSEIVKLKLDILDPWVDENGTEWHRPTSWAYAQVCRVKNEQQSTIDRLTEQREEALAALIKLRKDAYNAYANESCNEAFEIADNVIAKLKKEIEAGK